MTQYYIQRNNDKRRIRSDYEPPKDTMTYPHERAILWIVFCEYWGGGGGGGGGGGAIIVL